MPETAHPVKIRIGFPQIISVETDDIVGLFQQRRKSRGPFLIISRHHGLALDTAFRQEEGGVPIL